MAGHTVVSQVNLTETSYVKNLFDAETVNELKIRLAHLRPQSERQWGKMNPAQMLAHCSAWMEMAAGLNLPPRSLIGRVFGKMAKGSVLGNEPIRRNMPSQKSLIVSEQREFVVEQQRLWEWMERFAADGPEGCTKHPHCFFGPMTPMEWSILGYKHLDHHLRQFGV
jgi:Protein of unknown function (DUF1569)